MRHLLLVTALALAATGVGMIHTVGHGLVAGAAGLALLWWLLAQIDEVTDGSTS